MGGGVPRGGDAALFSKLAHQLLVSLRVVLSRQVLLSDSVFMAQITLKHWILTKIMLILSRFLARSHSCLTGCHRDYTQRPLPALTEFDDHYNLDRIIYRLYLL